MTFPATTKKLHQLLADTYALYLKTQNYHWHVKGPHFSALHGLFEEQYNSLAGSVDEIAERIVIIGGQAPATFKEFMDLTKIKDGDSNLSWQDMVKDLVSDQDKLLSCLKDVMAVAGEEEDEGTSGLASEAIAYHEKQRWIMVSHLA